jgi:hypothetical protein
MPLTKQITWHIEITLIGLNCTIFVSVSHLAYFS